MLTRAGRVLWDQYLARADYTEEDRPYLETVVRLHERLDQISAQLGRETKDGRHLMAPTVRGTTAHPLLGHEREIIRQLRAAVIDLDRRVRTNERVPETRSDALKRRLTAVK